MSVRGTTALIVLAVALVATAPAAAAPCGAHPWCDSSVGPDARAELLLEAMTLDEKLGLMGGDDLAGVLTGDPANGTSLGVPRLGVPTLYFNDGPAGIREGDATGLPAPIALAATFDPQAARRLGAIVGDEGARKGNHVIHAPAVNMVRLPQGGRTFEYYGEDPFLASRLAVPFIDGLQAQGVAANVKHYLANNHETDRFLTDAVVDERTLREIYLPAFEASVRAGVASVMVAYNGVNGTNMTENRELLNGLLRDELGFEGFTLTDYGFAQNSTSAASRAGTDLEMPFAGWYSAPALQVALAAGSLDEDDIDENVRRILRTMFAFGFFDAELTSGPIDVAGHGQAVREVEEDAIALLKNDGGRLPLDPDRVDSIAVIGPRSDEYRNGGGSSNVSPFYAVTPLDGIRRRAAAEGIAVRHDDGLLPPLAARTAAEADVAVVVVTDNQTEFVDKPCLSLLCGDPTSLDQDGLVRAVAAANPNTVVLLETGGPVLMPWADRVPAIVEAWYPGQEGGNAIASVLFGDSDPGGRLPVTFPQRESDTPTAGHLERYPGIAFRAQYSEGVFMGYRHYDEHRIAPLFPFGHGLSYTRFAYRDLSLEDAPDGGAAVEATVENVGGRPGVEVAQLYAGLPEPGPGVPQPPRWLKGFEKLRLEPGESHRVRFELSARDLSHWDAGEDRWALAPGCYVLSVGRSSRDLPLSGQTCR
ncbi:MAG: glycoside hydrolase family 3 C-terminal domain-containing protein [Thermoleophilaceae bacterium]